MQLPWQGVAKQSQDEKTSNIVATMSQSPTPGSAPSAADGASDWRADVQQSSRNKQVREIAKVLASLEPGASSTSKLRLAMQFEDTVFKGADSLADYQKKLSKRLKKLQKNYVPTQPAGQTEKQRTLDSLRQTHGDSIRYVLKHAQKAIAEMKSKHGDEKGRQLEQHLDAAKIWAHDLGLLENSSNNKPNYKMADDQLERLKSNIERRLENLRAHVVKLADPDRFFVETLEKAEEDSKDGPTSQLLMTETRKLYLQMVKTSLDPEAMMKDALDVVLHKSIPLPTRSQKNDEKAALIHLDKMRAASSAFLAFLAAENKSSISGAPQGKLFKKLHSVVTDGIQFISEVMKERRKQSTEPEVSLQDAWMKPLELHPSGSETTSTDPSTSEGPATTTTKRARLSKNPLVLKSQILLTRGRKTPPNLLVELKRKGVQLVRPTHGHGSHLILEFGRAFSMTIYMVPLLVELRACPHEQTPSSAVDAPLKSGNQPYEGPTQSFNLRGPKSSLIQTPTWTSLHYGLTAPEGRATTASSSKKETVRNKKRSRNFDDDEDRNVGIGKNTSNEPSSNEKASSSDTVQNDLTVWNVNGDYETIGHVVEERLRDASAHATFVLRQCFAEAVQKDIPVQNEFELEILEGQALLNFLHVSRSTYTPNWQDISV